MVVYYYRVNFKYMNLESNIINWICGNNFIFCNIVRFFRWVLEKKFNYNVFGKGFELLIWIFGE